MPDQPRALTDLETRRINFAYGEPVARLGEPVTCNSGNPDTSDYHDPVVTMLLVGDDELVCPECGRQQILPFGWNFD